MSLAIKEGVDLSGLKPPMLVAIEVFRQVLAEHCPDVDAVITSARDGVHMDSSLHYVGYGIDFRSKTIPEKKKLAVLKDVSGRLGTQFDVLLEGRGEAWEHYHIEFQPKAPNG